MYENYFIVDIETCPINLDEYFSLEEEDKIKKLNPIDSKIVAIGVRSKNENKLFLGDEKEILTKFWEEWGRLRQENADTFLVGFNVANFDIPFIVSKSFVHDIEIVPFSLKSILDIKDKINAYRWGKTRGKLEEYGKLLGVETLDMDGSQVPELCKNNDWETIKKYLSKDLEITEKLFERAKRTGIIHITRY
jgi:uncharacterized protein YprB with RNaseH-like and TPR domain